jgi:penicillin amidase
MTSVFGVCIGAPVIRAMTIRAYILTVKMCPSTGRAAEARRTAAATARDDNAVSFAMPFRRSLGLALVAGSVGLAAWQAPAGAQASAELKALARQSLAKIDGDVSIPGLREPVEIIRDAWGVTHIYAKNQDDMFFAQGFVMGQDRLWQLHMWRMTAEGRLSEILGPAAFDRDRQTRLGKFRGPYDDKEWTSYHPDGKKIFTAWTNGLNAYIAQAMSNLPLEFKLTGLTPEPWKPETPLLRGGTGDGGELALARLVKRVGVKEATRQRMPDPWSEIVIPDGLDLATIAEEAPAGGRGGRGGLPRPQIVPPYDALVGRGGAGGDFVEPVNPDPGSNNWTISGKHTATGKPIVANDPHREVGNPSLRYIVHLVSPGWNVIGAGEAPFVGVALGHNTRVAWGLTITGTDQTDTFIEETNPANPNEMKYLGAWEPFTIVREEIKIKGEAPRTVEFKISRHGPVFLEDPKNHRAYVTRSTAHEPGTAPYLAGLRLSQATDCKDFMERALYWKAPTENLNCGDVDGNISLQSSALTPNRRGWDGRMPVPGTGKYEWDGFRTDLPRRLNPTSGYIATANNNINTSGYWPPVVFKSLTAIPYDRITRVEQVLNEMFFGPNPRKFTIADSERLQHDAYMLQASYDQDLFTGWTGKTPQTEKARTLIAAWNAVLDKDSAAAAIYQTWRQTVDAKATQFYRPLDERRPFVEPGLVLAIERLTQTQGADWSQWRWGRMHTQAFAHPLVRAFDVPTIERSGGTGTPFAGGASYRENMDVADWDRSTVTNVPGQSAQPESEFYANLLPLWDKGEFFPMLYTRAKVDQNARHRMNLKPAK